MPAQLFQIISIIADVVLFVFIGFYIFQLYSREKVLKKKENKADTDYHQVVDDAFSKERKILEDATTEANQIISDSQHISSASKDMVNKALSDMVADIQKEALATAQNFTVSYTESLKQLSSTTLKEFQEVAKELETDLQKQIKDFRQTLLPNLEKELEEYKQARLKQADQMVTTIVQKASQEILNKSISLGDHQSLVIESLEKAKREGVFD